MNNILQHYLDSKWIGLGWDYHYILQNYTQLQLIIIIIVIIIINNNKGENLLGNTSDKCKASYMFC